MALEQNPARERVSSPSSGSIVITRVLLTVSVLWCIYWFVHAWQYWEDDAYIHLEFARSVAAGQGFAFNGRVVAGDTAPLWVLLLAGMHALIPDWLVGGKVLSILGAAFGLTGIYAFARRLGSSIPSFPYAAIFPAAMVLLIVANPYTCYWIFSGMESVAASGLACLAVLAATQEQTSARSFLTGSLLAGIAPLIRPEMLFLSVMLGLLLQAQFRRLSGGRNSGLAIFITGLILIALPLTLWSLYSLHAFGHILPNTNAAKRAPATGSVARHLLKIYTLGYPLIVAACVAGILYVFYRPNQVRRSVQRAVESVLRPLAPQSIRSLPLEGWVFILWPIITSLFYIANHTYVQTRYILVTAPGLTVVIMACALMASQRAARILYAAALLAAFAVSIAIARPFIRNKGFNCQVSRDLAFFIRDRLPTGAPVADYSIGEIAFYSQHPVIDTGGITRPGVIPYLGGSYQDVIRWARSQGAQYAIGIQPEPDATIAFRGPQRYIGWTFRTSQYATTHLIELWKLAPAPPPQSATPVSTTPDRH